MFMDKKILLILILFIYQSIFLGQSGKEYVLDDVVVTSSRAPLNLSDLTRSIVIINRSDIKEMPVSSVQDLLQYVNGLDLKQRGVEGVQADISIRGGSFEQTLILIDGIKISDPQTGHHNLNLPFNPDNIERIEVLKGQGSSIYGPNAFSGIVNIITKKPQDNSLSIQLAGGQYGYYQTLLSGSFMIGELGNNLSLSKKKSDGYRYNTNFDAIDFSYSSSFQSELGNANLFIGYNDKEFGANSFYSERFPNQWEHTTTKFVNLSFKTAALNYSLTPKLYWRRNDDEFLLNYENPAFYRNIHQTDIWGVEIQSTINSNFGITSIGGEYKKDDIESTNLGNHQRENYGVFAEHNFKPFSELLVVVSGFAYKYAEIGWKFWPGIDLSYKLTKQLRLFGSVGKAFRTPTYTELYYSDPVTKGNPDLKFEESVNYELGANYTDPFFNFNFSLFRKEGTNIIDWVRQSENEPWMVMNFAEVNTNGFESGMSLKPDRLINWLPINNLGINYTYLNSDKSTGQFQSRYVLDYLKHQLIINLSNPLPFNINQSWYLRYEDRVNLEENFIIDMQLFYEVKMFEIFIKATNLFNKSYKDIGGITLPGRWFIAGVKYTLR